MMKIGYFADGPWSHKALELIFQHKKYLQIAFIVPRFDTQDPVLREWAEKLDVPFVPHDNVNSDDFLDQIQKYEAELFISMSFNQILRKPIIELAPKGFINCHAGALPFYRGRNPLNWVLINDEEKYGITVHYVDEGIDTGDIIEQRLFPIKNDDTYASLLDTAIKECGNVLFAAIEKVRKDSVLPQRQIDIHPVGTYFGMRKQGDELIDFSCSSRELYNFVRGISSPGPCARCFVDDKEYLIHSVKEIESAPCYRATIGEVVGRTAEGVVVKTGDTTLLLDAMSGARCNSEIFVPKFRIGTRFRVSRGRL